MRRSEGAKLASVVLFGWVVAGRVAGQGLLVDQASATPSQFATQAFEIPDFGSIAQSFTPSLSAVGFVQLQTVIFPTFSSVTLIVNLRSGAYNGPIISSTTPVALVNKGSENTIFYFPADVLVTPEQLYFFEPLVQGVGSVDIGEIFPSSYDRGDSFHNGLPNGGTLDLWFREGIVVVPEPSVVWLLLVGAGAWVGLRRVWRSS